MLLFRAKWATVSSQKQKYLRDVDHPLINQRTKHDSVLDILQKSLLGKSFYRFFLIFKAFLDPTCLMQGSNLTFLTSRFMAYRLVIITGQRAPSTRHKKKNLSTSIYPQQF